MFRSKKEAEESLKQEELLRDKMNSLAEYLLREKEQAVYASNLAVAKNRGLLDGRWDKNDKKDAPMSLICQARAAASEYVGEFKDGKPNGIGTYTWAEGKKYFGELKNGNMEGKGTYTWQDGRKYVGTFLGGNLDGSGTLTWANGDQYVGEFKDGKKHGEGTLTSKKRELLQRVMEKRGKGKGSLIHSLKTERICTHLY